jgi:hypothetical protein
MYNEKSIVPTEILDRTKNIGTWDQVIAEAELAIAQNHQKIRTLEESVAFFKEQRQVGNPYPGKEENAASTR